MTKGKAKGGAVNMHGGAPHGKAQFAPQNLGKTFLRLFSYFKYNGWRFIAALIMTMRVLPYGRDKLDAQSRHRCRSRQTGHGRVCQIARNYGHFSGFLLVAQYLGSLGMTIVASRTTYSIRKELFEKVQSLPIPFFDKHGHGEVMSSFTNDIDMLNMALEQSIDQVLTSIITVVGTFAMMIVISPILTVVVVVCLAFMMLIIHL